MTALKNCAGCEEAKPVAEFSRDAQKCDGLTSRCKECGRAARAAKRGPSYRRGRRQDPIPVGTRFGRLVSVADIHYPGKGAHPTLRCRCECGSEKDFHLQPLKSGRSKSCGCLRAEIMSATKATHRGSDSILFKRWAAMRQRCLNPKHKNYHRYGGRGITICAEWVDDFQAFETWALKSGFSPELELDRRENDLGYSPSNCRWVTHIVNSRNRVHYSHRRSYATH